MRDAGSLHVGAEVVASSARFDDAANTRRMGGYALLNLTAEYQLGNRWTIVGAPRQCVRQALRACRRFQQRPAPMHSSGVRWLYQ